MKTFGLVGWCKNMVFPWRLGTQFSLGCELTTFPSPVFMLIAITSNGLSLYTKSGLPSDVVEFGMNIQFFYMDFLSVPFTHISKIICNLNRTTLICDVEMHLCQVNGHIMNEGHVKNWCFVVSKRGDVHEMRVLRSFRNSMSCTLFCEWWTILCWSMRVVWNPKMDSALIWRWEVIIL